MAVPIVQVRHKKTGRKTFLPETALANFPSYVKTPTQKSRDEVPDGSAFPGETSEDTPSSENSAATTSAPATTKGK